MPMIPLPFLCLISRPKAVTPGDHGVPPRTCNTQRTTALRVPRVWDNLGPRPVPPVAASTHSTHSSPPPFILTASRLRVFVFNPSLLANIRAATTQPAIPDLLLKAATTEGPGAPPRCNRSRRRAIPHSKKFFRNSLRALLSVWQNQVVLTGDTKTVDGKKLIPLADPLTGAPLTTGNKPALVSPTEMKDVSPSRRDRMLIRDLLITLRLSAPDPEARLAATIRAGEQSMQSSLATLKELEPVESNKAVKTAIHESIALIELATPGTDAAAESTRISAVQRLGQMRSARAMSRLRDLRKIEKTPASLVMIDDAIVRIEHWQTVVGWCGNIFSGLSASSILILMALGLSIIFGLMGVINMAHGELMMIGAYATFLIQQLFVDYLPASVFNWYFVVAIPASFLAAALVGMLIEATVIRFLYGRPLDTLLATLGVSFLLIQFVRILFGDNRSVNAPSWLQGSVHVAQDINLPYNRLFILLFCGACIALMYFIIEKTKLGLLLRATTQNRTMAASLGVSTRKIDLLTFGLGSGLAGMAGCALTQIGGVSPDMGQNYIIDSFLVVVTGGVGKLAGAIWSGLGLGTINKFLEPETGTVWAKVIVLVLVVAFLQRRPSGLFPAKGRLADV